MYYQELLQILEQYDKNELFGAEFKFKKNILTYNSNLSNYLDSNNYTSVGDMINLLKLIEPSEVYLEMDNETVEVVSIKYYFDEFEQNNMLTFLCSDIKDFNELERVKGK